MEIKEETLEHMGMSKNEAKVYLALARNGLSSAGKIAHLSKVHRTNVYDAIERLIEKGLVCYITKDGTKHFEATEPENLMNLIKEKEIELQKILPSLALDKKLAEKKSEVHVYNGIAAVRMILNHFLEYKKKICVHGIPKEAITMMQSFIIHFHERRIGLKIPMLHVYNEDAQDRIKYLNTLPHTKARYLPKEYNSPVSTNICGDEVVLILWIEKPLVIQIINNEIAGQYQKYFDIIWGLAKV